MKKVSKRMVAVMASMISLFAIFAITASAASYDPYMMDGRWCQNYSITISGAKWKYTTSSGVYPGVTKLFNSRKFLVQVNSNTLTAYQTAFQGAIAYSDGGPITSVTWVAGIGSNSASYGYLPVSPEKVCMGSRSDTRATGTYTNSGIWSPDTAY